MNVITNQFGYDATWTSSVPGSTANTAKVLYKEPTKVYAIMTAEFHITEESMEYKLLDFDGLFERANNTRNTEQVTISFKSGDRIFYVRKVIKKYDGDTYVATLEPI